MASWDSVRTPQQRRVATVHAFLLTPLHDSRCADGPSRIRASRFSQVRAQPGQHLTLPIARLLGLQLTTVLRSDGWEDLDMEDAKFWGHDLVGVQIYAMGYGAGEVKSWVHNRSQMGDGKFDV